MIASIKENNKFVFLFLIAMIVFCSLVFTTDYLLQKQRIYKYFSPIIKNYTNVYKEDGSKDVKQEKKPFVEIKNDSYSVWDGDHYKRIKDYLYKDKDSKYSFAFFPLFPVIWRLTTLSSFGITLFNYALFCLGMILFIKMFKDKIPKWVFFLTLCIPMLVVYLIPYTEALFFLTISIGLYGIIKQKYWIYFIGFMLASMTRSSASIFIIAFICTEILVNSSNFSFKKFIIEISKRLMPIVLGVFFVMLYQKIQGADSWFTFINAQKLWGKEFSLPKIPFSDWSEEGRSITFPFVYIFLIPMIIILIRDFIKRIKHKENTPNVYLYVKYLSMFYIVGNILVAILTQKGSLNSLARYILCNPFFVFLLFQTTIQDRNKKWQYIYCAIAFVAIFLCRNSLTHYNGFGIYLFILTSTLVFFHRYLSNKAIYVLLFITIALNILWTAYLLNAYLSDSWIYT